MLQYFININGNNKDLSLYEFENLWQIFFQELIILKDESKNFYSFKTELKIPVEDLLDFLNRLTFTNAFYEIFFNFTNIAEFENKVNKLKFDCKTFAFRFKNLKDTDLNFNTSYIDILWKRIKNPKVDLSNPELEFCLFKNHSDYLFSKKIFENKKLFLERMPIKRPVSRPYTLKSDLARCVVNFLNIKSGTVLDPFVGIGGILLEARDLGFNCVGADISWKDLELTNTNFLFYFKNLNNLSLVMTDSSKLFLKKDSIDGIVTDIPYGKSSRKLGDKLYENFLRNAKIYLKDKKRMVVIYANFTSFEKMALKEFKKVKLIEQYINKSMTRKILILENNKI